MIHDSENMVFPTLAADTVLVAIENFKSVKQFFNFPIQNVAETIGWLGKKYETKVLKIYPKTVLDPRGKWRKKLKRANLKETKSNFHNFSRNRWVISPWFTSQLYEGMTMGTSTPFLFGPLTCSISMFQFHRLWDWPENPEGKTAEA